MKNCELEGLTMMAQHGHMSRLTLPIVVLAITSCTQPRNADPLPTANQVKSLTIQFDHSQLDNVTFTATSDDWTAIRKTLLPSRRDRKPATWEKMGSADFLLNDDKPYRVELYQTSRAPGAFAAGKTLKSRVYFRGGNSVDLQSALIAAFEKSTHKEVDPARIRRLLRRADRLEIKVAKDAGGFYETLTLVNTKGNDEIEPLVKHLDFAGHAVPRDPGNVGTTVAADITAIHSGKTLETLLLRGQQIWFGPDHGYQTTLKTDALYRKLRELVGDPLP